MMNEHEERRSFGMMGMGGMVGEMEIPCVPVGIGDPTTATIGNAVPGGMLLNKSTPPPQEQVWPPDVEFAFRQALCLIPSMGRRKIILNGKSCGRNELISQHIFKTTSKHRTRKQVSSHIQVLKKTVERMQGKMEREEEETVFARCYVYAGTGKGYVFEPKVWEVDTHCVVFWDVHTCTQGGMGRGVATSRAAMEAYQRQLNGTSKEEYPTPTSPSPMDSPFQFGYPSTTEPYIPTLTAHLSLNLTRPFPPHPTHITSVTELQTTTRKLLHCLTSVYSFQSLIYELSELKEAHYQNNRYSYHFEFVPEFWGAFLDGIQRGCRTQEEVRLALRHVTIVQTFRENQSKPILQIVYTLSPGAGDVSVTPAGVAFDSLDVMRNVKPVASTSTGFLQQQ